MALFFFARVCSYWRCREVILEGLWVLLDVRSYTRVHGMIQNPKDLPRSNIMPSRLRKLRPHAAATAPSSSDYLIESP